MRSKECLLLSCMLDNHLYNLLMQMTEEHKSLWRVRNEYAADAGMCPDCRDFWKNLEKDKEGHVEQLQRLLKKHLG